MGAPTFRRRLWGGVPGGSRVLRNSDMGAPTFRSSLWGGVPGGSKEFRNSDGRLNI